MILATGAAVSPNIQQLVSKTKFVYRLINLEETTSSLRMKLSDITSGIWAIDSEGEVHDLGIKSVFLLGRGEDNLFRYGETLFAAGAVSDRLLKYLSTQPNISRCRLIVQDFTKLFISPEVYSDYIKRGGQLEVMQRSNLVAITLNPTSPQGYTLNSFETCKTLSEALECPVFDVLA